MADDSSAAQPRFQHPRVMMIDLPAEATERVRSAGYRVTEGSMGNTYRTGPAQKFIPVPLDTSLPGFTEQEVVVMQAAQRAPIELHLGLVPNATTNTMVWAHFGAGVFDTRVVAAIQAADFAKRILDHGGVFVVFCDSVSDSHLVFRQVQAGGYLSEETPINSSVYALVPELEDFSFEFDGGEEIRSANFGGSLAVLDTYFADATFGCRIEPGLSNENFIPLAHSKYGQIVAGLLVIPKQTQENESASHGLVFLLPQVGDTGECVTALLNSVLPVLAPRLFPHSESPSWLQEPEYELPEVAALQDQITEVRTDAAKAESSLRDAIAEEREQLGWMHDLLTETDDELVEAVTAALKDLGLDDVGMVDDEAEDAQEGRRREDIQVWGGDPVMLVEVKGISGLPKEAQSLQVHKYFVPRMRKWKMTDIRGLSVINQQRGLPALDRENTHVFQQDVLDNAGEQHFGLVTTIDLFRLVRNKRRWGWAAETVVPLFYENGRIEPVPTHYEEVGVIDGYFEKPGVVTVTLTAGQIAVGDEIAFRLPIDYEQETVASLQVDDAQVQRVEVGQRFGMKTALSKAQARNGTVMYRVG